MTPTHVPLALQMEQLHLVALLGTALSTLNLTVPQWQLPFSDSFSSLAVSAAMMRALFEAGVSLWRRCEADGLEEWKESS